MPHLPRGLGLMRLFLCESDLAAPSDESQAGSLFETPLGPCTAHGRASPQHQPPQPRPPTPPPPLNYVNHVNHGLSLSFHIVARIIMLLVGGALALWGRGGTLVWLSTPNKLATYLPEILLQVSLTAVFSVMVSGLVILTVKVHI